MIFETNTKTTRKHRSAGGIRRRAPCQTSNNGEDHNVHR